MSEDRLKRIEARLDTQEKAMKLMCHEFGSGMTGLMEELLASGARDASLNELLEYFEVRFGKVELPESAQERINGQAIKSGEIAQEMVQSISKVTEQLEGILKEGRVCGPKPAISTS